MPIEEPIIIRTVDPDPKQKPPERNVRKTLQGQVRRLKRNQRAADCKKRTRHRKAALLMATAGEVMDWGHLSNMSKKENVLSWYINGGVVYGQRFGRAQLSESLDLTPQQFEKLYQETQQHVVGELENSGKLRQQVSGIIGRLIYQLQDDRGRLVIHADILEREIKRLCELMDIAREKKPKTEKEKETIDNEIKRLIYYLARISEQKIETLRALFEGSGKVNELLKIFASAKEGSKMNPDGDIVDSGAYVDHRQVIKMIEDRGSTVLPSQKYDSPSSAGPRNPNADFEDLYKGDDRNETSADGG